MSITIIIIAITAIVSFSAFNNQELFNKLLFNPFVIRSRKEWYRFLSHAFVHGSTTHLLVNMYVLFMFGMQTERFYGAVGEGNGALLFIALYIGGVIFSSLPSYRKHLDNPSYNAIGASGATSAVLFAYVLMSPFQKLSLLFLPGIDFYAWIFGLLYLAYEYYMDKRSTDNVAHDAHFYGALYGILFTAALDPQLVLNFGYLNS